MSKAWLKVLLFIGLAITPTLYLFAGELTVGVFPRRNAMVTVNMFTPLIQSMEKETGIPLKLETARNFAEFWQRVKQNRYDIVHFNQLHYILSKKFGYEVFAKNEEFDKASISPSIVVRKDSGINSISDLKGKAIIFGGGKLAMVSYVAVKSLLQENYLENTNYKTLIAKNPPNAVLAVYFKKADAAGIGDIGLDIQRVPKSVDVDELKFLKHGKALPHLPWAFSKNVTVENREKISSFLLNLHSSNEGRELLKKAGLTNLLSAKEVDYKHVQDSYDKSNLAEKMQ